ncbi:MAG: molybdopterin-dependent oxidoreductase [Pseudomonadota bacterium]
MSPRDLTAETGVTRTTCPYCGVGCGVLATPDGAGGAVVQGDPDHPANFGRLCSKGSALGETIALTGRLLHPIANGVKISWNDAIGRVATAFSEAIAEHGPDSVAIYGSGQLLTEDYYVANKFMKGFIGSANIDTNSRLCMASTVAGHKRAFGSDTVPGTYEDLEKADLVVLVGSNLAWCHPVLYQRLAAAKEARPDLKVVNIDPRRTATSALADMHLQIAPGADVALFNALLAEIEAKGAIDLNWVADHVDGAAEALGAARASAAEADLETQLSPSELRDFFELWISTEKVVTVFSQGVNQSTSGVDKVNAIINCHLATGRIGRPGMGPFSVTGQPNAMGGREVGGLSNMLACHLDLAEASHRDAVQAHWNSPNMASKPGLKAVELFQACADGRIKALWIISTNPVVSMPEANAVRDAITATPFVAVSDLFADTDTANLANVVLPAAGWGEKSGTVTNSDRTISRQRAFLPMPGSVKPDWRIISDVAAAMGWEEAFRYTGAADIFREHAALSGVAARLGADFDISGLSDLSDAAYDTFVPERWPLPKDPKAKAGGRFFANGGFYTKTRRAQMIAVSPKPLAALTSDARPFRLNTGRVRDQWHTMTRTARAPRLNSHIAEPFVEIHPVDAARAALDDAVLARITSGEGETVARVLITDRVRHGEVFVPMHWTGRYASQGRIGASIASSVDPTSGQPELKGATCSVTPFSAAWYGFLVARGGPPAALEADYWALAPFDGGWRAEVAGLNEPSNWAAQAAKLLGQSGDPAILVDEAKGVFRAAFSDESGTTGALFATRDPVALTRTSAMAGIADGAPAANLLAGAASADQPDPGATICACFSVGANTISRAILGEGLYSVEQVGSYLSAGTNCGSCRPDIQRLLRAAMQ